MPGRAAGLRARPSAAAAVAFACANPQTADAIAMENPAVIATQLVPPVAAPPCANTGTAKATNDNAINTLLNSFILFFSLHELPQEVVDVILVQTPSH
jgi:hypothetical protein